MLVFDEEVEEVRQTDKGFQLLHIMLEVLLAIGLLPVSEGLRAQSQHIIHSFQSGEMIEDAHDRDVSEF